MRIGEAPSVRKPIPLTPLIDVVFLLLMFFMLSSTFTKFGTLDAGAAGSGVEKEAAPETAKRFPGAIIVVSGPGKILINGTVAEPSQLVATLDWLFAEGVTLVALRASKSANVQDLVSVLDLAKQSRVAEIVVMP